MLNFEGLGDEGNLMIRVSKTQVQLFLSFMHCRRDPAAEVKMTSAALGSVSNAPCKPQFPEPVLDS